jgi:putative hydrolase
LCRELNVKVVAGSDTHIAFDIGKFNSVIEVFKDINMPEELIMNTSINKMISYLESKGKKNINEIRALMED